MVRTRNAAQLAGRTGETWSAMTLDTDENARAGERRQNNGAVTEAPDNRASDRNQAQGTADDRNEAADRKAASDLKAAQNTAGIEGDPDYQGMIAARLGDKHPKTAEAFRNGDIVSYDSDRRLMGMQASRMETEIRHVVGAVAEVTKYESAAERWNFAVAATDRMLTQQSMADERRAAADAYAGRGSSQQADVYQSVFEKMSPMQQQTLNRYKRQIVECTERAADPSNAKYGEKQAAKDITRITRDANRFLMNEGVLDKMGNLRGEFTKDTAAANGQAAVSSSGTSAWQTAASGQTVANGQAAASGLGTAIQAETGATVTTGQAGAKGQTSAGDQNAATGRETATANDTATNIDRAMFAIAVKNISEQDKLEYTKNFIHVLHGKPSDQPKDAFKLAIYEGSVANYRGRLLENFQNDTTAYHKDRDDLVAVSNAARMATPERYPVSVNQENFTEFGQDGRYMKALRGLVSDNNAAVASVQNTLLDNISERVANGTDDFDKVATYAATVRGLGALEGTSLAYQTFDAAIKDSPQSATDPATRDKVTPSFLERAVLEGGTHINSNPATEAAAAALSPLAFKAAATGRNEAFRTLGENQTLAEFEFIDQAGLYYAEAKEVNFPPTEHGVTDARALVQEVSAQWPPEKPTGTAIGDTDNFDSKAGYFTVTQLARDTAAQLDFQSAAGDYQLSDTTKRQLAMLQKARDYTGAGSRTQ